MQTSNRDVSEIAEQAAEFVLRLEGDGEGIERELSDWLARSPRHLKEFMLSIAIHQQIRKMGADFQEKSASLDRARLEKSGDGSPSNTATDSTRTDDRIVTLD
jgi:ferric-dicitrate binding protein FerR (iron transport regulator)